MIGKTQRLADVERGKCANHINFAVCEVDQLKDAVNHGVAEGDESVDTSQADTVDEMLNEFLAMTLVQCESPS